jgi:hypothetical protein
MSVALDDGFEIVEVTNTVTDTVTVKAGASDTVKVTDTAKVTNIVEVVIDDIENHEKKTSGSLNSPDAANILDAPASPTSVVEAKLIPECLAQILSLGGPENTIVVPETDNDVGNDSAEDLEEFGVTTAGVTLELTHEQELEQIELFKHLITQPISKQDQWYVATIEQHLDHPVNSSGDTANPEWLRFRKGRNTGSTAGAVHGVNKYCSRKNQLRELLWNTFKGNHMTKWGNDHEDDAEACFTMWQKMRPFDEETDKDGFVLVLIDVENYGLCICRKSPFMAMSPDGFLVEVWERRVKQATVEEVELMDTYIEERGEAEAADPLNVPMMSYETKEGEKKYRENGVVREVRLDGVYEVKTKRILIEYKCPWKVHGKNWYDDEDLYPMEKIKKADGLRLPVPSYYYAQCSYGMHTLGVLDDFLTAPEYTYFVVWHPAPFRKPFPEFWCESNFSDTAITVAGEHGSIQICKIPYNQKYCLELEQEIRTFWHEEYAPALWRKLTGRLDQGESQPVTKLNFGDWDKAEQKENKQRKRKMTRQGKQKDSDSDEDTTFGFSHVGAFTIEED